MINIAIIIIIIIIKHTPKKIQKDAKYIINKYFDLLIFISTSIERFREENKVAGNQTQDNWLEPPVLCHWAKTTGQPPTLYVVKPTQLAVTCYNLYGITVQHCLLANNGASSCSSTKGDMYTRVHQLSSVLLASLHPKMAVTRGKKKISVRACKDESPKNY